MKRAAILLVIALAGCGDARLVNRGEARELAEDMADGAESRSAQRIANLEARVDTLERELADVRGDVSGVRALGLENAQNADSLRGTVNHNADLRNREKVDEMTRRGACGTEMVRLENGGYHNRRIPCTLDDLGE